MTIKLKRHFLLSLRLEFPLLSLMANMRHSNLLLLHFERAFLIDDFAVNFDRLDAFLVLDVAALHIGSQG